MVLTEKKIYFYKILSYKFIKLIIYHVSLKSKLIKNIIKLKLLIYQYFIVFKVDTFVEVLFCLVLLLNHTSPCLDNSKIWQKLKIYYGPTIKCPNDSTTLG